MKAKGVLASLKNGMIKGDNEGEREIKEEGVRERQKEKGREEEVTEGKGCVDYVEEGNDGEG